MTFPPGSGRDGKWISVRVAVGDQSTRDRVAAILIAAGAASVQEIDGNVLTFLDDESDFAGLGRSLGSLSDEIQLERLPAGTVSSDHWMPAVGIQRLGGITVAPPWLASQAEGAGGAVILIEPAMAFGTGEHETTRGVLRLMQNVIRSGDSVADLGAGSAVLSIAAGVLGASRVAAIECDPDAIGNAEGNVERNGLSDRVVVLEGDAALLLPLLAPVRVVFANIISSVIVELLPVIRASLMSGGQAILSGILLEERDGMKRILEGDGWTIQADDSEGEWWSTTIARR